MKTIKLIVIFAYCLFSATSLGAYTINFDRNWQFILLDDDDKPKSEPKIVNLPHDWSIEGSYSKKNGDWQNGFLPFGKAIYRKKFDAPCNYTERVIKIHFDGIYRCSDVWLNGHHLGFRPNGFIGIEYELTPYLKKYNNILEVRVDHSQYLSNRSYTGSGIYRHVWLKSLDKLHIATDGTFFSSSIKDGNTDYYKVSVKLCNQNNCNKECILSISFIDPNFQKVEEQSRKITIAAKSDLTIFFEGSISKIKKWSPSHPTLYDLNITISEKKKTLDISNIKVGFRDIKFDSEKGFFINGEPLKIRGVCERSTAGAMGAAVPDDVLLSKIRLLKEMGCNAIRTAHHPFAPEFYDICDSLGLMVMDEMFDGWEKTKAKQDYGLFFKEWWRKDASNFICRDRNHPCVIIWSIGNEVHKPTLETQREIIDLFTKLDPTRLTTQGGHDPTRDMKAEEAPTLLGVKGFNGDGEEIGVFDTFHNKFPEIPIIGTEIPHTLQTRGVYRTKTHWRKFDFPAVWEQQNNKKISKKNFFSKVHPIPDLTDEELFPEEINEYYYQNGYYYPINNNLPKTTYYQSSYDNASVRISTRAALRKFEKNDYLSGSFRWTGFDYLGESNGWPSRFMNCGVIDICGIPKDHFYLYQSLWSDKPMVHILPHWTHPGKEKKEIPVVIYTNAERAELLLNGKSLGIKENNPDIQMVWYVPYQEGEIKAMAYNGEKVVATTSKRSAGNAFRLCLHSNRESLQADGKSVAQIEVNICDRNYILCPNADEEVKFEIKGGGRIIGVDNGDPLDLSDYKSSTRRTFRGKAMLWIQSDGSVKNIYIKATARKRKSAYIVIPVKK